MITLTRQAIIELARRNEAHAALLPRTSERYDIMLAAATLRKIVTMGFPVGPIEVQCGEPPLDLLKASSASDSSS